MSLDTSRLDNFLGKKLQLCRSKVNWPLKTLASELNISLQQLHRYEQGVNKIPSSLLFEMVKIFNISVSDFFEGYGAENSEQGSVLIPNILLIEDDLNDTFLFNKALSEFHKNTNLYTVPDGDNAIKIIKKLGKIEEPNSWPMPNIIFLDLCLPYVQGLSILKEIKSKPVIKNVPVIIISNSLNTSDIQNAYNGNANGFIRKSFSFEEFKTQLHNALVYWTETVLLP
jgi:CheY-like chemotaxis protein